MTIESSNKPGVAKHSAAGSNHSWGKTVAGGKSSPDTTGGFGSILAALDPAVGGEVDFGPPGAKTSEDVLLGSMASAPVPSPGMLPLGGELESVGGGDHSPISNLVSESLVPEKVSVADPTSLALLVDPSSQTPAGNLIAAELIESSTSPPVLVSQSTVTPASIVSQATQKPVAMDKPSVIAGVLPEKAELKMRVLPEGYAVNTVTTNVQSLERPDPSPKESPILPARGGLSFLSGSEAGAQPDVRAITIHQQLQALMPDTSAYDEAAPLIATATVLRRDDSGRERSVFRSNSVEVGSLESSFVSGPSITPVQYTSEARPVTDMYIAEKVAYWISHDVQNAELKLDGIGVDPVEVTIRMHGNEAHVAFRTDEMQARAALESASSELKDMLQREGLTLSGVSIGGSGAGGPGDQERNSRQGGHQAVVTTVTPAQSERVARLSGTMTGSALDLFV